MRRAVLICEVPGIATCTCGEHLAIFQTAYGLRTMACRTCDIRWTWIKGESDWTAEPR